MLERTLRMRIVNEHRMQAVSCWSAHDDIITLLEVHGEGG